MKVTSALANKKIKMLEEEKARILERERMSSTYILADGECASPPEYDYVGTKDKLDSIDSSIRKFKHAINVFNTTTYLESVGVYIDEALLEMASLSRRKPVLNNMATRLEKERVSSVINRGVSTPEYKYANYDVEQARKDLEECSSRLIELQLALDTANQTIMFDIDD